MARRIYKTTDKITVKIDDIEIKISPLSFETKCNIQANLLNGDAMSVVKAAQESIKHAVKEIKGIENEDGSPYELKFENGVLTDSCVDDLLNVDEDHKISMVCTTLLNGIPKDFINPETGKRVEGIKIERKGVPKKGKS